MTDSAICRSISNLNDAYMMKRPDGECHFKRVVHCHYGRILPISGEEVQDNTNRFIPDEFIVFLPNGQEAMAGR
jgi:hypothetical protein